MATVKDIVELINEIAPEKNAIVDGYDNVGLIVGRMDTPVEKVVCCLDATEEVICEALSVGAQMIIAHHPMIFMPTAKITDETVLGRKILTAIENGVAIYGAHTSLDFSKGGINDYIAKLFHLENVTTLDEYIGENEGLGKVGDLNKPMYVTVLKAEVEKVLCDAYVRIIGEPYDSISRVAVINGAGGGDTSYIDMALKAGADCLITADVKHHVAVYAKECGLTVIEPQHYTMEYAFIGELTKTLNEKAREKGNYISFVQAEKDINPRF
ncbi:MAG: Nif3-like dinuclear metal center hexameric protein [Clostridia bacterium]|nr:Nif3-like dinuclear metal center hexameric protein [Clostridia bacterium]